MMNIAEIVTHRHTCKAFDQSRRIPDAVLQDLLTVLRYAPSSVNSQPWHFVVVASDAARTRLAETLAGAYAYNAAKVAGASHTIILCARRDLDDAYLNALLDQEQADGRFSTLEGRAAQNKSRLHYVNLHRHERRDLDAWVDRQVYIALGGVLLVAAQQGIDACPMEGIDPGAIDAAFGLAEKGLRAVVLAALGYGSADDFNARLPKSRLPGAAVISEQ